mmetsp:Transcript_4431/g.11351  ORF Transcript_4431/g.11351 Transcript_4431/m.11351 type:complete len:405 (+) Transcript_4431:204-1418(+)
MHKCAPAAVKVIKANFKDARYPVNTLRNLAWSMVKTSHVFILDIDFWPSFDLRPVAELALRKLGTLGLASQSTALVAPAFHLRVGGSDHSNQTRPIDKTLMPSDFDELLRCVTAYGDVAGWRGGASCAPFHHHGSTRFADWTVSSGLFRLPCFITDKYEPFVIVRNCVDDPKDPGPPHFDERFDGYGKNKLEFIASLRGANYSFYVVPRGFVVHAIHAESPAYRLWKKGTSTHRRHVDALFEAKLSTLFANRTVSTPLCPHRSKLFRTYEHPRAWSRLSKLAKLCRVDGGTPPPANTSRRTTTATTTTHQGAVVHGASRLRSTWRDFIASHYPAGRRRPGTVVNATRAAAAAALGPTTTTTTTTATKRAAGPPDGCARLAKSISTLFERVLAAPRPQPASHYGL